MATSDERLRLLRTFINIQTRTLRKYKKELGLCIENWCKNDTVDGMARCTEHLSKAMTWHRFYAAELKKARKKAGKAKARGVSDGH